MTNKLARKPRICRVCGRPGVPRFQRRHEACKDREPPPRFPTCQRCKTVKVKKPGEVLCSGCRADDRQANRPLRECRKCHRFNVVWKQGVSTCDDCNERTKARPRLAAAIREEPHYLAALEASGEPMTLQQIAVALGCSHEQVRREEARAMESFVRQWQAMFGERPDTHDMGRAEVNELSIGGGVRR